MIDLRYVKKLIDILDESTVDSIEISSDKGMKIRISKSPSGRGAMQVAPPAVMAPMLAPPMIGAGHPTPAQKECRTPTSIWEGCPNDVGATFRLFGDLLLGLPYDLAS